MRKESSQISAVLQENILKKNPWYVGSQFAWAAKPSIRRIYEKRYKFFVECIDRVRKKRDTTVRLLDAGCGDGYWLWKLKDIEDVELIGVDYNPLRVDRARQVAPEITVHHCDIMDFTSEEPFDIVLLNQVAEHLEDDMGLLHKMRTLLSENGVLILGTPNEGSWLQQMRRNKLAESYKTDHVHFYVESEIVSKLHEAGFTIDTVMREAFYVGDDDLYYDLLETDRGFQLLEFLTFLMPTECSDFYFECRPAAANNQPGTKYRPPESPTKQEITQKFEEFERMLKCSPSSLAQNTTTLSLELAD